MELKGKHIVLGISGSIAAYKAAILARLLIKQGAEVQIVITPSGKEFITPITLSALTSKPVISEFFSGQDGTWNSHVDIGLWADLMIVAPATAATLGKMAHGIADNMLLTVYLSMKAPVMIAPAMDLDMYAHPTTRDNLELLSSRGNIIIDSTSGFLASHLQGKGRMQEPEVIVEEVIRYFREREVLRGKKVVLTAGPTYERLDPVRYLGNFSTGKMGISLADEFARLGAEVVLVLGPSALKPKEQVKVYSVTTALEMLGVIRQEVDTADIAVFTAAVADYRPKVCQPKKMKRKDTEVLTLELVKNPDIAATLAQQKRNDQFFVGFALESGLGRVEALSKLESKGLDAIVLNSLADKGAGFATSTNKITIFGKGGQEVAYPLKAKDEVARDIVAYVLDQLNLSY